MADFWNNEEIVETAKAVQETAKTSGKAIDASRDLGRFLGQIFGEVPSDLVGLAGGDWLHLKRQERIHVLAQKTNERLQAQGIKETIQVPLKVAIPLIENASLEEDDELMDMWAALLTSSLNPNCEEPAERYQVDILSQLGPAEAILLKVLWLAGKIQQTSDSEKKSSMTIQLEDELSKYWRVLSSLVQKRAIHNIVRLRLAQFSREQLSTDRLFVEDGKSSLFAPTPTRNANVNPRALGSVLRAIDWGINTSSGWIEPRVFHSSQKEERYANPHEGVHLISSGYFLMKTCHDNTE
ncbi:MAG: DUF4393 domain-containing protein [Magnetovibrio sp.]|nr:DUF4393 domain-containing protein [Magnetovibrio sp.]